MLLRRPVLWFLLLNFLSFLLSEGEIFVLELFGVFFVLWGHAIVQFVLKLANITEQRLHGNFLLSFFLLSGFILLFYWILESSLLILSCKVRSISFGVLGSIFFKRVLDLSIYLRDGSTPTSPAQGSSSRVIWNSLLRICCSQIAEVTTDPNLIVSKGFSPCASGLPNFWTLGWDCFTS